MNIKTFIKKTEQKLKEGWKPLEGQTPGFTLPESALPIHVEQLKEHFLADWTVSVAKELQNTDVWPLGFDIDPKAKYTLVLTPNDTEGEAKALAFIDDLLRARKTDNKKLAFEITRADFKDKTGPRFFFRTGAITFTNGQAEIEGSVSIEFSSVIPEHKDATFVALQRVQEFIELMQFNQEHKGKLPKPKSKNLTPKSKGLNLHESPPQVNEFPPKQNIYDSPL